MEDGRQKMEVGRWKMEDGKLKTENGSCKNSWDIGNINWQKCKIQTCIIDRVFIGIRAFEGRRLMFYFCIFVENK
ncbi:MAG: hypothetical protein U9R19_07960 [Bacteroidota bacterium]|nr:hypothetical protein [Bacteroidota bacterium]